MGTAYLNANTPISFSSLKLICFSFSFLTITNLNSEYTNKINSLFPFVVVFNYFLFSSHFNDLVVRSKLYIFNLYFSVFMFDFVFVQICL